MKEEAQRFFSDLWGIAVSKHDQGVYNTVCLAVLLALPLVVLLTSLIVCCHCCCCRNGGCCCCCCRSEPTGTSGAKSNKKKKKKDKSSQNEDLWISVKPGPMTPDRMALTMV